MAREYFKNLPDRTTPLRAERINGLLNGEESIEKIVAGSIEGKNLFDKSDSITLDSSYTASGAITTTSGSFIQESYIKVKPSTKYTLSANNVSIFRFCEYASDKTFITRQTSATSPATFTTGSTTQYIRISGNTVSLDTFQIELGENATEYDKFNRYSYNSVESMGNIVVDDLQGSNLLDKNYIVPITSTGTTITQIENGINVKNTSSNGYGGSIKINVKENTDYYIQYDWADVSNGINRVGVFTTDSQTIVQKNNVNGFTFNSGSNTVVVIGFYAKNGGVAEVTYTNIKLSLGTNRKEYSTYKVFDNTAYVLWTNPDTTASFSSQNLTLIDDIYNYKYYEVLFCYNTSTASRVFSTGKIPVGMQSGIFMSTQYNYRRYINFSSNAFTIADCVYYATYGSSTTTTVNNYLIPYQLIAYK